MGATVSRKRFTDKREVRYTLTEEEISIARPPQNITSVNIEDAINDGF